MARSETYFSGQWTLAAGADLSLNVGGRYVTCLEANADFALALDDDAPQFMAQGLSVIAAEGEQFQSARVVNNTGGALTVRLAFGTGDLRDARLSLTGALNLSKPGNIASTADVAIGIAATVQILAASPSRREAIISNLAANLATLRVGDASAGAARGVELAPGSSIVLTTTAAIYAHNPGGAAQSVAVIEVLD